MGTKFKLTCERRLTNGNIKHPKPTSKCQFPLKLNLNQSDERGRKLERQSLRIAIPVTPSTMSVKRLYNACPLYVRYSFLKPAV
ncbi:hypothetical protein HanIR_Chr05g0228481 [Helianthus annuus]|nr:hypothetical protein HanIR_Chr05g0228481 [Helianthus annuus]